MARTVRDDQTAIREAAVASLRAGQGFPIEAWHGVWMPPTVEADPTRAVQHVRAFWGVSVPDLTEALGLDAFDNCDNCAGTGCEICGGAE